jgi:hypothetical protein
MVIALKFLYFLFWLFAYSFATKVLVNSAFPKLKLSYLDYAGLLTVVCLIATLFKMVWELTP